MKKQPILTLVFLFVTLISYTQEKLQIPDSLIRQTLVCVDTTNFSVGDFVWFYSKYSSLENTEELSLQEYFDKFVDYKLKVAEAENLQLDTSKAFREEFFKYLKMTAHDRMYRGSEQKRENLVKLEYDRLHWDYEVAHIFIKSNKFDNPKDTLIAWNTFKKVKQELANGKAFKDCVHQYSDDNLSKVFDGNVGFVTAMVSPFEYENALYNAKVGETVTARTEEGWYFIKVLQKRPTRGAVGAAIILIYPQTEDSTGWNNARITIDTIYAKLQNGIPFDSLSNQYNTNERLRESKGALGLVDNGMPYSKEIKETLFNLQNDGDYSKPLRLPYGYAIVERMYLMDLPEFEAYRVGYEKRINSDKSRNTVVDNEYEVKMKQQLHFKENRDELENCMQYIDASILLGKWTAPDLPNDVVLFEVNGEKNYRSSFFSYLQAIQKNRLRDVHEKDMLVRLRYEDFVTRRIEISQMQYLQKNDKDFQYTMQEYHDGMMVYNLIDKEVIKEAAADSVGMKFYFKQHRKDYQIPARDVIAVFSCNSESTAKSVLKLLENQKNWYTQGNKKIKDASKISHYDQLGTPQLYIVNAINTKTKNAVSVDVQNTMLKTADDIIDTAKTNGCMGMCEEIIATGTTITVKYFSLANRQQTIKEAKDQLSTDYQAEVERKWMKELQQRHEVKRNQDAFSLLQSHLRTVTK